MSLKNKIKNILNRLIRHSYWYQNILFPDCAKFWKHNTFNLDVINLGSSSGKYAFNYDKQSIKAANWAMGPQTLVADFEILRNYSTYLKAQNAIVLIPLCPFSCLGGSCLYMPDKYYTILNFASIPQGNYKKAKEIKYIQQNPLMYFPLIALISEIKHLFKKKKDIKMNEGQMQANAEEFMKGWMFEFSIMDFKDELILKNKDAYEDSVKILSDMIDFCLSRNIRPVLVLPPVTKYLAEKFTPEMLQLFVYDFVKKANKQSITFLDYWNDPDFLDISYFQNSFFLNYIGAQKFTAKLLNDLKMLRN